MISTVAIWYDMSKAVLRIHICMFLALPDPDPCLENIQGHFYIICLWVMQKDKCFLPIPSWFLHHDGMYARKWPLPCTLCVLCMWFSLNTSRFGLQCMSPRRNWDSPNPSLAGECAPPPRTGGVHAHSPAGEGLGGSANSDDWRKSLALFLLCGPPSLTCKYGSQKGGAGV